MKNKFSFILCALTLITAFIPQARAQEEEKIQGIPKSIYYLVPSFSDGTIYIRGQSPVYGKINICALDNTLRFIDKNGTELEAGKDVDIVKVRIDTVIFIRYQDAFYRVHPLSQEMGIASRRDLRILNDAKEGAYGMVSQTTSTQQVGTVYSEGATHVLNASKDRPYSVSELLYIYKDGIIYQLSRKSLKKLFPAKKEEIDAFFKGSHTMPQTVDEALEFLSRWIQ